MTLLCTDCLELEACYSYQKSLAEAIRTKLLNTVAKIALIVDRTDNGSVVDNFAPSWHQKLNGLVTFCAVSVHFSSKLWQYFVLQPFQSFESSELQLSHALLFDHVLYSCHFLFFSAVFRSWQLWTPDSIIHPKSLPFPADVDTTADQFLCSFPL